MKQTDIDRQSAHFIRFIAESVLTQEDALALGKAILSDHGIELLKAHPVFVELEEK